jgi:hypothetical protein
MDRSTIFILSLSIFIPLITGIIRYGQLPVSYMPLIYLLAIGFLNEVVCYVFFYNTSNAIPGNIYLLAEFLFFTWQFKKWRFILRRNWLYKTLMLTMAGVWITENIIFGQLNNFSPYFQVISSMVLILLAVNQLNWLIVNERGNILTNPIFIICIAIIIFFSYKVLIEIFYHYAPEKLIKNNIFMMQSYLNVGYNIILAIAILCIPRKKNFIQPFM